MTKEWAERLPKKLRISAYDFRLELWDSSQAQSTRKFGEFSAIEQRITIQAEYASPVTMVDTLLHEILHAIYWVHGIDDKDEEERIVNTMAVAWTQVWRDNPALLDWLTAIMVEVRK